MYLIEALIVSCVLLYLTGNPISTPAGKIGRCVRSEKINKMVTARQRHFLKCLGVLEKRKTLLLYEMAPIALLCLEIVRLVHPAW